MEQITQRDHGAGLAGSGGHDHQRLALVLLLEGLGDAPDGPRLVVPLDNCLADRRRGQ